MSFGFGFGFPRNYIAALFTPRQLFTAGVNGAWYDPSDFSTMFQNAAGTTPVTAVGQPVGLMLDKSKGLVLGSELVTNGTFTSNVTGWTVYGDAATTISWDAGRALINAATNSDGLFQSITTVVGRMYQMTATFERGTATGLQATTNAADGNFQNVTAASGAISLVFSASSTSTAVRITTSSTSSGTFYIDNISVRELPGNHAFNPSGNSANFPVLQQAGGLYYLAFNGVNQWLQTSSIDFTYGDKMFVSAGVRKLSDAASGMLAELSANINANNGSFYIVAPSASGTFEFSSRGTTPVVVTRSGFAAPITAVTTLSSDISSPRIDTRVNTVASVTSTSSQGTGNYGNYPLYIGARAGFSLFFNGRLYGLVVAGKQASASEIASTEAWLNQKTGAY